ncbi:MAG: hypothetical protein PSU94_11385 [Lacunisphaera sp.]|nr:hypothetical protein [Lacunisphaera sp.]
MSQNRQIAIITAAALAVYLAVRLLPTGTNLSHMDFRVEGKGADKSSLEFCDPANPQFIPVVQVRSPIVLSLQSAAAPARGQPANFTLTLRTASGKPIAPEDLLVAHTRKLHLLVVDPTLNDYQHLHPEPGRRAGEWVFTMAPQRAGLYRVFADFTPAATSRGLYGVAEFTVPGTVPVVTREPSTRWQNGGFNFELVVPKVFRAGQPADLAFRIQSPGTVKQPVPLQPVMGAFAHLVAFDETRSGFAHLHPAEVDLAKAPDALRPELHFKVTIPAPGRYAIWAQVNLGGTEVFAPFWVDVAP